jgi:hypothetical protein
MDVFEVGPTPGWSPNSVIVVLEGLFKHGFPMHVRSRRPNPSIMVGDRICIVKSDFDDSGFGLDRPTFRR